MIPPAENIVISCLTSNAAQQIMDINKMHSERSRIFSKFLVLVMTEKCKTREQILKLQVIKLW